jgi:hypothetical protein
MLKGDINASEHYLKKVIDINPKYIQDIFIQFPELEENKIFNKIIKANSVS